MPVNLKTNILTWVVIPKNKPDHSYTTPSWVQHLSFGGLTEPPADWVKQAQIFETLFKKFHKEKMYTNSNIIQRLTKLIKKKCNMPEDLIKAFILQRTYIRIKILNNSLIAERSEGKKTLNTDRKSAKKMKKIIT